jgi:hypothetical protein
MNLYIDFDGVILDTIPYFYKKREEEKVDKDNPDENSKFFINQDWSKIIREIPQINNSIECIKKLKDSNKFNIAILTHVHSLEEGIQKINYLEELLPDITKIIVPKAVSKTKIVQTKDAILVDDYSVNLSEWEKEGGIPVKFSRKIDKVYPYKTIDRLDKLLDLF